MNLKQQRQWYAEELRWSAGLKSERLVRAFASVPRENFLGRGPWHILGDNQFVRAYTRTSDGNGFSHNPGQVDVILVNAGVAHLSPTWLELLRPNGRLVVPLTLRDGGGQILKVDRGKPDWHARFVSGVGIYHCVGGRSRSAESLLKSALAKGGAEKVRSLRLDGHDANRDCWLHGQGFCLSRRSTRNL